MGVFIKLIAYHSVQAYIRFAVYFQNPKKLCHDSPFGFFVSVISVYRGYFIGNQNMTPPAVSQITEAIIKLTAGLALAKKFLKMGLEYAVMAAFLGITVSEIITLIILFILSDNKKA